MSERSSLKSGLGESMWAEGHQGRNQHTSRPSSFLAPSTSTGAGIASLRRPVAEKQHGPMSYGRARAPNNEQMLVETSDLSDRPSNPQKVKVSSTYQMLEELDNAMRSTNIEQPKPVAAKSPAVKQQPKPLVANPQASGKPSKLVVISSPAGLESAKPIGASTPAPTKVPKSVTPPKKAPISKATEQRILDRYSKLSHLFEEGGSEADQQNVGDHVSQHEAQPQAVMGEWSMPTTRYCQRPPSPDDDPSRPAQAQAYEDQGNMRAAVEQQQHVRQRPITDEWSTPAAHYETEQNDPLENSTRLQGKHEKYRSNIMPDNGRYSRSVAVVEEWPMPDTHHAMPSGLFKAQADSLYNPQKQNQAGAEPSGYRQQESKGFLVDRPASNSQHSTNENEPSKSRIQPTHAKLKDVQHDAFSKRDSQVRTPLAERSIERENKITQKQTPHLQAMLAEHLNDSPSRNLKENIPPNSLEKPTNPISISVVTTLYEEPPQMSIEKNQTVEPEVRATPKDPGLQIAKTQVVDDRPGFAKAIRNMQTKTKDLETIYENTGQNNAKVPKMQADMVNKTSVASKPLLFIPEEQEKPKPAPVITKASERTIDDTMNTWLEKGARMHEKMQRKDPRAKSHSPAQAWGKGLVGETRPPPSATTRSSGILEEQKDYVVNNKARTANGRDTQQVFIDHRMAVAMQAQDQENSRKRATSELIDAEIAAAIQTEDWHRDQKIQIDAEVARSVAAEDPRKPRFEPSAEVLQWWTPEPGGPVVSNEPEQLFCNVCVDNPKNYLSFPALQSHKVHRHHYCVICDVDFGGFEELVCHKVANDGHYYCHLCNLDFSGMESLGEHNKRAHPIVPNPIKCSGCGAQFISGSAVINHIEASNCPNISPDQFVRSRYLMVQYQRRGLMLEGTETDIELKREHIARLSEFILGDDRIKAEFAKRSLPSQNPFSNSYDPSPLLNQHGYYVCPYAACTKSWPQKANIIRHLRSGHFRQLVCPSCRNTFPSPSALIAHMESTSNRCKIVNSELYADTICAVSGGYLRAEGKREDGQYHIVAAEPPDEREMERLLFLQ